MEQFAGKQLYKTLAMFGQYLLPLICLIGAGISVWRRRRRSQLADGVAQNPSADALNGMNWQEFEMLVGEAFRRRGFAVAETGGGGADGGVDLVLTKDGEKLLVQCKQWRAYKVGVNVVRELYGVMAAKGAAGGYVVTSGQFTQEAKDFASGRNITLMDGAALKSLLGSVQAKPVVADTAPAATRREPAGTISPACPKCGGAMVKRVARQGSNAGNEFWGCSQFPACKGVRGL
jgi:Predicted endonuclease distantly related to archaeal Holliday junction resolvase and Mrr-like restriction enzymes